MLNLLTEAGVMQGLGRGGVGCRGTLTGNGAMVLFVVTRAVCSVVTCTVPAELK